MVHAIPPGYIQICGVIDDVEAALLVECGVRYLGFPLRLPVHREDLSERDAARIIHGLAPLASGVLITYLDRADSIVDLCRTLGTGIVQLHGDLERAELERIRSLDPSLAIIKSLVVGLHPERELDALVDDLAPCVDAFLTDTFDPRTGAAGATGRPHDWSVSRRLVERSPRPLILAGGLAPDNVRAAIHTVRPAGVDVHTGVEDASGRKARAKVEAFVREAEAAFAEITP
jgi:phosphoribosylanthranilate isomerase